MSVLRWPPYPRSVVALLLGVGVALACNGGGVDGASGVDLGEGSGGSPGTGADGSGGSLGEAGGSPDGGSSGGSAASPSGGGGNLSIDSSDRRLVEGGTYPMGRSDSGLDACPLEQECAPGESPEHDVSVSSFWLDRFEVTVEQFRPFADAYPREPLGEGAGAHPLIAGSGWQLGFEALLPDSKAALLTELSCGEAATFSAAAGSREDWPVNCVSWVLAFRYCAEVGGRLPTEAEWERAAAGGEENRLYPWGDEAPDAAHASFFPSDLGPVGAHPAGKGRFGHEDLAGSVWEWALDWLDTNWYAGSGATCTDCARVSSGTHRVLRGGAYSFEAVALRAAVRSGDLPEATQPSIGFRCAYDSAD